MYSDDKCSYEIPYFDHSFYANINCRDAGSNVNNVRWEETVDADGEFDELRLVEEGEPRYGLVQVSESILQYLLFNNG